ncbi:MAG: hypothetical protein ACYDCG_10205 [Candidatus Acidiferrales bacterium]
MNLHRFLAYTVLACWIGLTAVTVGTALQWSAAGAMTEVKVQRALNAQKDASAGAASTAQVDSHAASQDQDAMAQLQRSNDRAVAKAEAASEAMGDALNFELAERKQFWWEFGVWGCLTLLASALLAERRDGEERSSASK